MGEDGWLFLQRLLRELVSTGNCDLPTNPFLVALRYFQRIISCYLSELD